MRHALLAATIAFALPAATLAQGPQRIQGTVTAASDTSLTLDTASGPQTIALLPERRITVSTPTTLEAIQPGSYVATANVTQADGSGVSREIRVSPPGSTMRNVNRPMDASGQLIMTNGTVATVVSTSAGRVLTVDYGNGQRQIRVPPEVKVISNTPGTPAMIKPGVKLSIATMTPPGGGTPMQMIMIDKADLKP